MKVDEEEENISDCSLDYEFRIRLNKSAICWL